MEAVASIVGDEGDGIAADRDLEKLFTILRLRTCRTCNLNLGPWTALFTLREVADKNSLERSRPFSRARPTF